MDQLQLENSKMSEEQYKKKKEEEEGGGGKEKKEGKEKKANTETVTVKKVGPRNEKQSLGNKELEIMRLCFEQGFLSMRQVWQWLFNRYELKTEQSGRTVAARSLRYLKAQKFIEVVSVASARDNQVLRVSQSGVKVLLDHGLILERDAKINPPEMDYVAHDLLVTDIRLIWERILPKSVWYSERLLRSDPNPKGHLPDAVLSFSQNVPALPLTISIEVELTQKSRPRYEKKIKDFKTGPYNLMFYFTHNDAIGAMIHEVCRDLPDESFGVYVCRADAFLKDGKAAWFASPEERFQIQGRLGCVKG